MEVEQTKKERIEMPKAEVYSFAAAATLGKKVHWVEPKLPRKAPLEIGDVWVCLEDRDTCVIQAKKHSASGRVTVYYTMSSSGETAEASEKFFREYWCEKEEFLCKTNKALSRVVKLRAAPPPMQKGWEVWRENETGEFYIITGRRRTKNQTIHSFLKGTTQGEISAVTLEEYFTLYHIV
jgi:hypothetical protein